MGFTLLECIFVIVLTIILLLSVLTSYRHFVCEQEVTVLVDRVTTALTFARDSAITQHATIMLCAKNNAHQCGSDWQNGQLIINRDTQKIIRELPKLSNNYRLYWRSTLDDSTALVWRPDGFTRGQQGSFFICGKSISAQIIILRTGRWRVVISNQ